MFSSFLKFPPINTSSPTRWNVIMSCGNGFYKGIFKCNWCSPPLMPITSGFSITKSVTNRCPMVHIGKSLKSTWIGHYNFFHAKILLIHWFYFIFVAYLPCCLLIYYKCFIFLSFTNWTKVSQSFNCWIVLKQTMPNIISLAPNIDLAII